MITRSLTKKRRANSLGCILHATTAIVVRKRRRLASPHIIASIITWRNYVIRARLAASLIIKTWRRYVWRRPLNERDPFTLEPLQTPSPEDGGVWYDLVLCQGKMYRYSANALYTYIMSNRSPVEPLQRHTLNRAELSRLDRTIDFATRIEHGWRSATEVLEDHMCDARTRELHRSELAFFFEDDIHSVLNNFFTLICNTRVYLEARPSLPDSGVELVEQATPIMTLTLSFGVGEHFRLGSRNGSVLPTPSVPYFESLELTSMLRNNLRHRWSVAAVTVQLYDMLQHLHRCSPTRAIDVFHDYILPSTLEITDRMAAFDAQLAMEFGLEINDLRGALPPYANQVDMPPGQYQQ